MFTTSLDRPIAGRFWGGVSFVVALIAVVICVAGFVFAHSYDQQIGFLTFDGKAAATSKWLGQATSFGLYQGYSERNAALDAANQRVEISGWVMCAGFWVMTTAGAIAILMNLVFRAKARNPAAEPRAREGIAGTVVLLEALCWCCLICGIVLPSLIFLNTQDHYLLEFVGDGGSKSIVTSNLALLSSGKLLLATILLTATVVCPVAKLIMLGVVRRTESSELATSCSRVARLLKKTSIVEVIVACQILSLFAIRSIGGTKAEAGWGLYLYCLHVALGFYFHYTIRPREVGRGEASE